VGAAGEQQCWGWEQESWWAHTERKRTPRAALGHAHGEKLEKEMPAGGNKLSEPEEPWESAVSWKPGREPSIFQEEAAQAPRVEQEVGGP
jgi:hypothetical protein